MTRTALRRPASVLLALTLAVGVPVFLTGPTEAAVAPTPVETPMRSYALADLPATSALAAPGARGSTAAAEGGSVSTEVVLDGEAHVVGVTWPAGSVDPDVVVEMRERTDAGWSDWQDLDADSDDAPDPGTEEAEHARGGTSPWVTTARAVQVRVLGDEPGAGRAARFDVVDATTTAADESLAAPVAGAAGAAPSTPTIYSRAQWGADESIRHAKVYEGEIKTAIVHHTAGSNSYTSAEVPSIIRGIYVFHTNGRDWGDIGYNFVVDKFGRTWEGRYGGTTNPMVGAHAFGYNSQSFGVSVLGEFTNTTPPAAVPTALSRLIAWKLGIEGIDPTASTTLDGLGSAPTVIGHRDVNETSCPGTRLYSELGDIRTRSKSYQGTMLYGPSINRTRYGYGSAGVKIATSASRELSWQIEVTSPCASSPVATVTGTRSGSGAFTASWNGKLADGSYAPPGDYTVELTAASSGSGLRTRSLPASWDLSVVANSGAPPSLCPPRLSGGNRYSGAVAVATAKDPASRKVVLVNGAEGSMPDALVAGPLARTSGAVLLLTHGGSLTSVTRTEITRRDVTDVTIVGGAAAVSAAVVDDLRKAGVDRVSRVGGANRYEVAANVARKVAGSGTATDVFAASGADRSLADGLVLSGPAAALGRPIVLVQPDALPQSTATVLSDLGVARTVVAGGPAAVSADVLSRLPRPTRVSGRDRYASSAAVAAWATRAGVGVSSVLVASGVDRSLVDTLSGGQLGRATVYVRPDGVPSTVSSWLAATDVDTATVLGGPASVSLPTGGDVERVVRQ